MSKKSFSGGLSSLLEPTVLEEENNNETRALDEGSQNKRGRPKTVFKEITKTSQVGTKEGETRATFIVNEEMLEKVKAVAYWDRVQMKELVNDALKAYFSKKGQKFIEEALLKYRKKGQEQ